MPVPASAPNVVAIASKNDQLENVIHEHQVNRTYWLPSQLFVCDTQDCVVFLDARRGKYIGVGGPDAQTLRAVLAVNSSEDNRGGTAPSIPAAAVHMLDALVARGLLTLDPTSGRMLRQIDLQPGSCAVGMGAEYQNSPRLAHIVAALVASVSARLDLRFRGVGGTVARLLADKCRRPASISNDDELRRLVCIFRTIRPFLYTKRDRCLFHGLALYKFLRHYGFSPTWVIGVSTGPFSAHCWVQHRECVLDDSPETTLEFTPLAAI